MAKLNFFQRRKRLPATDTTPPTRPILTPPPQPGPRVVTALPRFDPTNPEHRVLWYVHLRRVKRYGKAAALFRDPDDDGGIYL